MGLSRVVLLRDNLEAVADVLEHALAGDVDAQFAAGMIYAEGRGVDMDRVQAFYWLTQAIEQGDEEAGNLRLLVGADMSDEEYDRAVHLIEVARNVYIQHPAGPADSVVLH
jgi:uncharacterized protein